MVFVDRKAAGTSQSTWGSFQLQEASWVPEALRSGCPSPSPGQQMRPLAAAVQIRGDPR